MYVFEQTTAQGFYPSMFGSVHGEDIAYLLGMPLVGGTYHHVHNYTDQEVALSELLMVFLVNFAKTGSPGSHVYRGAGLAGTTVTWPRYESSSRAHLAPRWTSWHLPIADYPEHSFRKRRVTLC